MTGKLNEEQVNNILSSQAIGRIGCTDGERPYIVPVTYAFDGKYIYSQTQQGKKLTIMRQNPQVCLQVDMITNMDNWQSVIINGIFQELNGKEEDKARSYLYNKVLPLMTGSAVHAHEHGVNTRIEDTNRVKEIIYRIKIKNKTGMFEKQ